MKKGYEQNRLFNFWDLFSAHGLEHLTVIREGAEWDDTHNYGKITVRGRLKLCARLPIFLEERMEIEYESLDYTEFNSFDYTEFE